MQYETPAGCLRETGCQSERAETLESETQTAVREQRSKELQTERVVCVDNQQQAELIDEKLLEQQALREREARELLEQSRLEGQQLLRAAEAAQHQAQLALAQEKDETNRLRLKIQQFENDYILILRLKVEEQKNYENKIDSLNCLIQSSKDEVER